jgi:predicted metal-dependent hydrolase
MSHVMLDEIRIDVVRKKMKNIRLTIYPSTGKIRLSVPKKTSEKMIQSFLKSKLDWIKKHSQISENQIRINYNFETGENHAFLGTLYPLEVIYQEKRQKVELKNEILYLLVNKDSTKENRQKLLNTWYRKQLEAILPEMIAHWENIMQVKVEEWRIKSMKTKWGTCNITKKRIWLNLELIKKTKEQLEYVVVHEMVHLFEKYHNKRFYDLMTHYLPNWKEIRKQLNQIV